MTTGGTLDVLDVSKSFGGVQALDGCTFSMRGGGVTGLIGPNGAGKSTVVNVVTGFVQADRGTVRLGGHGLHSLSPLEIARIGVGRTFQDLRLFDGMTVLENLLVAREASAPVARRGRRRSARGPGLDAATAVLDRLGLSDGADRWVRELSYAERKLVSLGRVLMTEPRVVFLDEPSSGVDLNALDHFGNEIRTLRERGAMVGVIEHNVEVIRMWCDDVVFMTRGQVLRQGSPGEVFADPTVLSEYVGGGAAHA
ncbi:ABC transporter ATP-binding protein [Acrocarpospora macrocephala]|uniref:ABC transporter ATP-binding protein n=1 Tax=Acrocarpospora macrocephala TaxID=150177 RepID=A0A5M3XAA1_9ACTN|nr:ATP-binding cassette domain-containing protein [Acrocarpospora macrocephala]GES15763.1 ABC transporter ATP-binding protein [Acrocarpospora macrocephala]